MIPAGDDSTYHLRQSVYWLLICLGAGMMLGRIMAVDSVDRTALAKDRLGRISSELDRRKAELQRQGIEGEALETELSRMETQLRGDAQLRRPFLSANDRSRWCTVRALVEPEMRVRGAPYAIDKVIQDPNGDTIDMVKHDGHLYSSKPPLLATLMAGLYWIVYHFVGLTLGGQPFVVGRIMLVVINLIPLVACFVLLARLADRFGASDWGRLFVMAGATFGTFLTTFAVTINNHLTAAVCATAAVYYVVPIWHDGQRRVHYFLLAGFFGALMAAFELPALALFAVISVILLCKAPRQTILAYIPAAIVVAAAFFATAWIAHGTLAIPYSHRSAGDNWYDYTYQRNGKEIESYWRHPTGIDLGEQSQAAYALNVLVGHHGIFSLTPIWLITVAGIIIALCPGQDRSGPKGDGPIFADHADQRVRVGARTVPAKIGTVPGLRQWAAIVGGVSVICIVFYVCRPLVERNYGGMTSGFRWVFWLAPLWLLMTLPALDLLSKRRWTRAVALLLLVFSVVSASYPTWNPWTNPWIMDFAQYLQGK